MLKSNQIAGGHRIHHMYNTETHRPVVLAHTHTRTQAVPPTPERTQVVLKTLMLYRQGEEKTKTQRDQVTGYLSLSELFYTLTELYFMCCAS